MKYIFVISAPGSKSNLVANNIYFSPNVDRTDAHPLRESYIGPGSRGQILHQGAEFGPGMEFGEFLGRMSQHTREQCEAEFDRPFIGTGVRIIKCHVMAQHIDFVRATWPDCPVVLVHRADDACMGWWVKSGQFDITYPNYASYVNFEWMCQAISQQNAEILSAWDQHPGREVPNNLGLCIATDLALPPDAYFQNYQQDDVRVKVLMAQN